jgi:hypothetical protein
MHKKVTTIVLAGALAASLVPLAIRWRSPGNNQGYEPVQPIDFSHRLHAGTMQIACVYCHLSAETSRYAGIPSLDICMNCHRDVIASSEAQQQLPIVESQELRKLYDALALDNVREPIPGGQPRPIAWLRVHQLPDFVYFDHRAHVTAAVPCQHCHGAVDTMDRMRQAEALAMGWCVNCHRDATATGIAGRPVRASVDCTTCHY